MDVAQRDRRYLAREDAAEGVQFSRSQGCFLFDQHGKKYIDFTAGWCVGNLGWSNKEIRAAIRDFDGPTYVHPDYLYRGWTELAEGLAAIAPGKLTKCYRATGGSEAVEIALQVAMAATGGSGLVSLAGCYHGNTIGGRSLAGERETYPNLLAHCRHVEPPLDDRAANRVERLLKGEKVAAFIMEPVVCNLGVLIPSKEFMTRVRDACRKHGTLFIMDEVATGFGRTGKLFASEHFKLDPGRAVPGQSDHRRFRADGGDAGYKSGRRRGRGRLLLNLRLAPALRRGGAGKPEVLEQEPCGAARERGDAERLLPGAAERDEVRGAGVGAHHGPGDRHRVRRAEPLCIAARRALPRGGAAGEYGGRKSADDVPRPDD
jgi:Aminotransferase class-III